MLIEKISNLIARLAVISLLVLLVVGLNPQSASSSYYAPTSWPAMHHDSRNSDSVLFNGPDSLEIDWEILDYRSIFAAVTIGPRDGLGVNLYVTNGHDDLNYHLHVYNRYGIFRWRTDLLDSGAVASSATVDVNGDIYIGDSDELFAFHSYGGPPKWRVQSGQVYSSAITTDGYLVTVTKDGVVQAHDRADGSLAAPRLYLPVGSGPPGSPAPDGLWEDMLDPEMIQFMYNVISGTEYPVTNTPAVNPVNNRIYIVTGDGWFFGIDFDAVNGTLDIAFEKPIGIGSQTSPAISPDGSHIYVADHNNPPDESYLYAFNDDENNPEPVWQVPLSAYGESCPGSPSVGRRIVDGNIHIYIYFLSSGGMVVALEDNGNDYTELWAEDFTDFATAYGYEAGRANSIISVARNYLYVAVSLGRVEEFFIPERHFVCILDPDTGDIVGEPVEVRDFCLGSLTMDIDGHIYVTHGGFISRSLGGVTALKPTSSLALAQSRIQSGKMSGEEAFSQMTKETLDNAAFLIDDALNQLQVVYAPLQDAEERGEITSAIADSILQKVNESLILFDNAKKIIEDSQITDEDIENGKAELSEGIAKLNEALALLP